MPSSRTRVRRPLLITGAAAVAVVAVVLAPRLLDGHRDLTPTTDSAELMDHGGPCPDVLPTPEDDGGHGFGTDAPAGSDPGFADPDAAWVCQYVPRDLQRTSNGGTVYEWARVDAPRGIDDAVLPQVSDVLDTIADDDLPQVCTADLGPRWLLVTASGGDLTGTAVDDFGCRGVRLTGDPFTSAPGDEQADGTVAGVLTGPPDLAATLQSWWDDSPADDPDPTAPARLHVTCTDAGPQVDTTAVAAQSAGVVLVVDSTLPAGSYLTYTSAGDGPAGGDRAAGTTTYPFPPGELTLSCATPPGMDAVGSTTVEVTDPHGYWRDTTLPDLGCRTDGAQPSWAADLTGSGATARTAVDEVLGVLGPGHTADPAEIGYSGAATRTWVVLDDGRPALTLAVTSTGDDYEARPDALCGG